MWIWSTSYLTIWPSLKHDHWKNQQYSFPSIPPLPTGIPSLLLLNFFHLNICYSPGYPEFKISSHISCIDYYVLVSLSTDPFPLPFRNYDMNWLWKGGNQRVWHKGSIDWLMVLSFSMENVLFITNWCLIYRPIHLSKTSPNSRQLIFGGHSNQDNQGYNICLINEK